MGEAIEMVDVPVALLRQLEREYRGDGKPDDSSRNECSIESGWGGSPTIVALLAAIPESDMIGDGPCRDCGRDPLIWSAPNWLWNGVMDPTDEREAVLCSHCFMLRAEEGHPMIWRLAGVDVDGELPPREDSTHG